MCATLHGVVLLWSIIVIAQMHKCIAQMGYDEMSPQCTCDLCRYDQSITKYLCCWL